MPDRKPPPVECTCDAVRCLVADVTDPDNPRFAVGCVGTRGRPSCGWRGPWMDLEQASLLVDLICDYIRHAELRPGAGDVERRANAG